MHWSLTRKISIFHTPESKQMCQTLIKECHSLWFDIRVPFKSAIQVCHLLDKIPGCHKDFQSRRCKRPWCFRRPSRQTHETSSARQLEFFFVFSRWAYEVRRCRRQLTYRSSFAYKQIRAASCCQSQSECNPKHYRIVLGDGGGYAWWVVFLGALFYFTMRTPNLSMFRWVSQDKV